MREMAEHTDNAPKNILSTIMLYKSRINNMKND